MRYEMPVLTEEQKEQLIEFIKGEQESWSLEGHYSTMLRIALAALSAEGRSLQMEGWLITPLQPTEQMIAAWRKDMGMSYAKVHAQKIGEDEIVFAYQAMLNVAPEAPCLSASSS